MRIYHTLDRNRHGLLILGQAARRPRVIGHHVDQDAGEFGDGRNIQGCQGRRQNVPLGCRRSAKSNRLVCQEVATVGFQALPVFAMLLSTVSSFLIQAVRASFLGFPTARKRW